MRWNSASGFLDLKNRSRGSGQNRLPSIVRQVRRLRPDRRRAEPVLHDGRGPASGQWLDDRRTGRRPGLRAAEGGRRGPLLLGVVRTLARAAASGSITVRSITMLPGVQPRSEMWCAVWQTGGITGHQHVEGAGPRGSLVSTAGISKVDASPRWSEAYRVGSSGDGRSRMTPHSTTRTPALTKM